MLAFLMLLAGVTVHAASISEAVARFPELPTPPQTQLQWIARGMRMNGLPMTIQALYSHQRADALFLFYESWAKQAKGMQTRQWRTRESQVLSIKTDSSLTTIELQQSVQGAQGTIVTSLPPQNSPLITKTDFPHPTSWRIANLQQYEDEGKETEHITFTATRESVSEARAISELLEANGWHLVNRQTSRGDLYVLEAQLETEQARIVIAYDGDRRATTLVTVLWNKG
jgi:hypothetical protein